MLISPLIESFFLNVTAASVTELFSWLLLVIFLAAVVLAALGRGKSFTSYAPNFMTSLGILGTFAGIVIGLMHFDTGNIDASIPVLLEGLKTAFITSVCGLVGAVLFTLLNTLLFTRKKNGQELVAASATPEMIYSSLEAQRKLMETQNQSLEQNRATLALMQKGLTGDEEGSLIGQFKLLRADMSALSGLSTLGTLTEQLNYQKQGSFAHIMLQLHNRQFKTTEEIKTHNEAMAQHLLEVKQALASTEENTLLGQLQLLRQHSDNLYKEFLQLTEFYTNHTQQFDERLFKELAEFADMMSRSATGAIIEALEQVIKDFNKNLTEQFGDNFKALDASVKKLVDWQESYRTQVEQMGEQYQQSVDSLVSTRESVAGIWQECQNIPQAMNELREIIDVNQRQIQELARHLEAFVAMRDKAIEAVPTIQQQVQQVTDNLSEASSNMRERLLSTSQELLQGSNEMKVALTEGAEHFRNSVTTTQQSFNELSNVVKNTSEAVAQTLQDTSREVDNNARNTLQTMQSATQEVQTLATQLTTSSQQAVDEFKRVSSSLSEELSRNLNNSQSTFEGVMRDAAQSTHDTVNRQLEQIEQATAREIQRAMQEMANHLTNITQRFVDDYQTMVDAMERVVNSVN